MLFPWKSLIIAFVVGILLDYLWLALIAKRFYMEQLSPYIRIVDGKMEVIYWAGAAVYLLIALAIALFVIPYNSSYGSIAFTGAILGFIMYGVYDMTNMATIKDWPLKLALVDMLWGTFLVSVTSMITYFITLRWL